MGNYWFVNFSQADQFQRLLSSIVIITLDRSLVKLLPHINLNKGKNSRGKKIQ